MLWLFDCKFSCIILIFFIIQIRSVQSVQRKRKTKTRFRFRRHFLPPNGKKRITENKNAFLKCHFEQKRDFKNRKRSFTRGWIYLSKWSRHFLSCRRRFVSPYKDNVEEVHCAFEAGEITSVHHRSWMLGYCNWEGADKWEGTPRPSGEAVFRRPEWRRHHSDEDGGLN